MLLTFTKMQALGNDFVVIDNTRQTFELTADQARFLADRHFGVGCDQILLIEPPGSPEVDFNYRIFNADGGEVEQCGNGARCFARYVNEKGLSPKPRLKVRTKNGDIELIYRNNEVSVDMGVPRFEPRALPFLAERIAAEYELAINGRSWRFGAVSVGNPHVCSVVDDVLEAPVAQLAPLVQQQPDFPNGVNVGFMEIVSPEHIKLRVFERGVGETLACGSGACAAVAIGRRQGRLAQRVQVDLPGGRLSVEWQTDHAPLIMTGPAEFVFHGQIEL